MDEQKENCNLREEAIKYRMDGFDTVTRSVETGEDTNKFGKLPYGFKRYMTCPICGDIMEIESLYKEQATYNCKSCNQEVKINI